MNKKQSENHENDDESDIECVTFDLYCRTSKILDCSAQIFCIWLACLGNDNSNVYMVTLFQQLVIDLYPGYAFD
ncbi:unnamed protein product [Cunninghamella blakesleeana]